MSLEQAEREYFKYLQNKVKQNKQAAIAAELAAVAAQPSAPVAQEAQAFKEGGPVLQNLEVVVTSKKRGRKSKQQAPPMEVQAIMP
jgi:hypothetical protein